MILAILLILVIFWFMGYGPYAALRVPLFDFRTTTINLWDILIFLLIVWMIDLLPSPIRQIAIVLLLIWLLATLGIIAVPQFSSIVVIALIAGLVIFLLSGS